MGFQFQGFRSDGVLPEGICITVKIPTTDIELKTIPQTQRESPTAPFNITPNPTPVITAMKESNPTAPLARDISVSGNTSGSNALNDGLKNALWDAIRNIIPTSGHMPHESNL